MKLFSKKNIGNSSELAKSEIEASCKQLYRSCRGPMIKFVRSMGGNKEDAEDMFQDAIFIFLENSKKGVYRKEATPCYYLKKIIKYSWLSKRKKLNKLKIEESEEMQKIEDKSIDKFNKRKELVQTANDLLESLENEKHKKTLQYFYINDWSFERIARVVGWENEQVARNAKYKAIKQLKGLIKGRPHLIRELKDLLKDE